MKRKIEIVGALTLLMLLGATAIKGANSYTGISATVRPRLEAYDVMRVVSFEDEYGNIFTEPDTVEYVQSSVAGGDIVAPGIGSSNLVGINLTGPAEDHDSGGFYAEVTSLDTGTGYCMTTPSKCRDGDANVMWDGVQPDETQADAKLHRFTLWAGVKISNRPTAAERQLTCPTSVVPASSADADRPRPLLTATRPAGCLPVRGLLNFYDLAAGGAAKIYVLTRISPPQGITGGIYRGHVIVTFWWD